MYTKLIQFAFATRQLSKNAPKIAAFLGLSAVVMYVSVLSACNKSGAETARGVDVGDAKAAAAKVNEGDKLYAGREDLGKLRQAVALLRQARIEDYGSFDAAWKLARASYYLGDHTTDDRERDNSFREGEEAGKAAIKLENGRPEGHFWLGANYGGIAKYSTLASLSSVDDIRSEMEAVLKLDEGFQSGSAYLVLGQVYLQAPRVLGGDVSKAISYLEKGQKFGENNALLRLRLAEAYHAAKRDDDARREIERIASMKIDPEYAAEYKEAVQQSKKLSAELK